MSCQVMATAAIASAPIVTDMPRPPREARLAPDAAAPHRQAFVIAPLGPVWPPSESRPPSVTMVTAPSRMER